MWSATRILLALALAFFPATAHLPRVTVDALLTPGDHTKFQEDTQGDILENTKVKGLRGAGTSRLEPEQEPSPAAVQEPSSEQGPSSEQKPSPAQEQKPSAFFPPFPLVTVTHGDALENTEKFQQEPTQKKFEEADRQHNATHSITRCSSCPSPGGGAPKKNLSLLLRGMDRTILSSNWKDVSPLR